MTDGFAGFVVFIGRNGMKKQEDVIGLGESVRVIDGMDSPELEGLIGTITYFHPSSDRLSVFFDRFDEDIPLSLSQIELVRQS